MAFGAQLSVLRYPSSPREIAENPQASRGGRERSPVALFRPLFACLGLIAPHDDKPQSRTGWLALVRMLNHQRSGSPQESSCVSISYGTSASARPDRGMASTRLPGRSYRIPAQSSSYRFRRSSLAHIPLSSVVLCRLLYSLHSP